MCLFPHQSLPRRWASCQPWASLLFCWPYSSSLSIRSFVSLVSEVCRASSSTADANEETALGFTRVSVSIIVLTNVFRWLSFALFLQKVHFIIKIHSPVQGEYNNSLFDDHWQTEGVFGTQLSAYYMHWTTHMSVCSVGCPYLYSFLANTHTHALIWVNPAPFG